MHRLKIKYVMKRKDHTVEIVALGFWLNKWRYCDEYRRTV